MPVRMLSPMIGDTLTCVLVVGQLAGLQKQVLLDAGVADVVQQTREVQIGEHRAGQTHARLPISTAILATPAVAPMSGRRASIEVARHRTSHDNVSAMRLLRSHRGAAG